MSISVYYVEDCDKEIYGPYLSEFDAKGKLKQVKKGLWGEDKAALYARKTESIANQSVEIRGGYVVFQFNRFSNGKRILLRTVRGIRFNEQGWLVGEVIFNGSSVAVVYDWFRELWIHIECAEKAYELFDWHCPDSARGIPD